MANKDSQTPCPTTGANIFKGLNLVDIDSMQAGKAQAALTSAPAKRQHEDPDSSGESSNKKLKLA